ncbi:MAG TPA: DNA-formamidopyrimidine glycosylase family protein [Thermoanaerobaculia bacterium]|nr:DNA-formamidopyrimidine glycosylase family protein [Thermoanaerobaculia bacterium]
MPEGDTIFRAARRMQQALSGKLVTRFESMFPQLNRIDVDAPVSGRSIDLISSRGKHLLIEFSGDLTLRTHMRMNGSWHLYRPGEAWRRPRIDMRIVIESRDFVAVGFNIPVAEFHDERSLERQRDLQRIGPDFLSASFDETEAIARLKARSATPIAEALLNQRVVSGIGNVFKSEVLFTCGVYPFAPVHTLGDDKLAELLKSARKLMALNVRSEHDGAITTYTGFRRTTGRSDPAERLFVYGRRAKPCRQCGTPIEYEKRGLDARSTYWCPTCQSSDNSAPSLSKDERGIE